MPVRVGPVEIARALVGEHQTAEQGTSDCLLMEMAHQTGDEAADFGEEPGMEGLGFDRCAAGYATQAREPAAGVGGKAPEEGGPQPRAGVRNDSPRDLPGLRGAEASPAQGDLPPPGVLSLA